LWRKFDFLRQSLASAGKSQARFTAGLLTYLALLWGWNYTKLSGFKVMILGVELNSDGLWMVTPAVLTVFVLALIGSMNIMGPIWKRVRNCCDGLGVGVFWTDTDPNKTLIDFFTHLRVWPEGPVEPFDVPRELKKYRLAVFSYPAVITFDTVTTALADYSGAHCSYRIYIYACVLVQVLFSFRVWYRAVCRFFGVRKDQTEI
jgi:hypothetical protein